MRFRMVETVSVKRTYEVNAEDWTKAQELIMSGEVEPQSCEDEDGGCWTYERLYPVGTKENNIVEWLDVWSILEIVNKECDTKGLTYIVRNEVYADLVKMNALLKERTNGIRFIVFSNLEPDEIPPEFDTYEKRIENCK